MLLQPQYYYNLVESTAYFIAAIVPFYFILKSRKTINRNKKYLETISILLVSFILMQVIYHIVATFGFKLLAKGILEPLSILALLFFGLSYFQNILKEGKLHKLP